MQDQKQTAWAKRAQVIATAGVVLLWAAGCEPDLGTCDTMQLGDGTAIPAGQMVLSTHCASGRCHSELAKGKLRYGASAGLNFADVLVTSTTPLDVVKRCERTIKDNAHEIWGEVDDGDMPPKGQGSVSSAEKEQLRNWLACGAKVVETPQGMTTTDGGAGGTWTNIYANMVVTGGCFACHSNATSTVGQGFTLGDAGGDQCTAYKNVFKKQSVTATCKGKNLTLVVPGDPANSFLLQKLKQKTPPCGAQMPLMGTPLPDAQITALEQWIAAGALAPECP